MVGPGATTPVESRPACLTQEQCAWTGATKSACLTEDPELFFPIGNTGPALLQIEEAKKVCRRCTVREQCLAWALGLVGTMESGAVSARTSGAH